MEEIIKISLFAIAGVLTALFVKSEKPCFGMLLGLAMGVYVLGICMGRLKQIMDAVTALSDYLGPGGSYLGILIKMLGITYICEFAAGTCRDAGYGMLAGQVELLGKLSVMVSGISILLTVIEQLKALA